MKPSLTIVPETPQPETTGAKVRRLQLEAKVFAKEHVRQLSRELSKVEALASEIADGGDVYPPGVRDLARRLVDHCDLQIQTLEAIVTRQQP